MNHEGDEKSGEEMPLTGATEVGSVMAIGEEPQLAPGVRGILLDLPRGVIIPAIFAEKEGSGDVGRYLDSLPKDRCVVFPTVLSRRLRGMLLRRGFKDVVLVDAGSGEPYEALERQGTTP